MHLQGHPPEHSKSLREDVMVFAQRSLPFGEQENSSTITNHNGNHNALKTIAEMHQMLNAKTQ